MAANTSPIYSRTADIQWVVNCTAANNNIDITSGTSYLAFTADATEGGYVRELRIKANPSQNTAATVARIWLNTGGSTSTDTNSVMIGELGIPATTASATVAQPDFIYQLNMALPASYCIYVTFGTAPGGSGEFMCCVIGGKY